MTSVKFRITFFSAPHADPNVALIVAGNNEPLSICVAIKLLSAVINFVTPELHTIYDAASASCRPAAAAAAGAAAESRLNGNQCCCNKVQSV